MKTKTMRIKITLLEEILGTASNNPEIHSEYIASKAPDAKSRDEEIASIGVDAEVEKGMTVFSRDADGNPVMWGYQLKGFFKDACSMLRRVSGTKSAGLKAFKKEIDGLIFIKERMIPFEFLGDVGSCQRPLRAQTAQGERISLANSETIPEGATLTCTVECFVDSDMDLVREWLDYGKYRGLGQWRNSGKGRFTWEEIPAEA